MAEERKKWDPARGTAAGLIAPTAVGLGIGVPSLAAISGSRSNAYKSDSAVIAHVKQAAKEVGVGVHKSKHPIPGMDILLPAYQWEHKPSSGVNQDELFTKPGFRNRFKDFRILMKEAQREKGIQQIESMTGSTAEKGIGMTKNIRPYMKPGILAHETGHALQPKWLKGAAYRAGTVIPGLAATYVAGTSDEKRAKTAATIGSIGSAGTIAAEFDASRRGARLLKQGGMRGLRRFTSFGGFATYGAVAAAPWAAYAGKKAFGGYKPQKPTEKRLNAILDELIEFREKDKEPLSAGALRARQSMTATGALVGAYAGGLIGAERGSMASGLEGMKQSTEKFKRYAQEDQARATRKDFERYDIIEDRFGGQQKLLKGRERTIGSGEPFRERVKSVAGRFGKAAKEIPTRAKYAAQDLAHGAGKWITRSSLSRSIAIGAGVGTVAGRYLGTKFGRSLDQSNKRLSRERTQAKIRRQATEIAKAQAMADSITNAMNRRKQLSVKLDDLIEFADPRPRNPLGEFQQQGEGGPNPNAMATVYKQGKNTGIVEGAGAALTGGALGAVGASVGRQGYRSLRKLAGKIANKKKL